MNFKKSLKTSIDKNKLFIFLLALFFSAFLFNETVYAADPKFDILGADTKNAQGVISFYIKAFGGSLVAFGLMMTGFKMILASHKEKVREEIAESFSKIILGSIILGSCMLFAGFLANITNNMGLSMTNEFSGITSKVTAAKDDDTGTFLIRGFAELISVIPEAIFSWFGSLAGFLPLNQLIFNKASIVPFGISGTITIAPFTDAEWHNLNYIYLSICTICAPLILIMVAKTGIGLIFNSITPTKRAQLQEDVARWFFSAVIVATAPLMIKGLFLFFNGMTDSLANVFDAQMPKSVLAASDYSFLANLKTGSVLTTAIVKFLFAWKYVEINLVFLSRKIILVIMYAFTPIAAFLWGINNRIQASQIWLGEIITNASMQFFYAFTYSVMILSLGASSWQNWLYALIWMFALIKIAEVLRNSLQGLFTRMSGIDESRMTGKALGALGSMVSGASMALGSSFSGSGNSLKNGIGSVLSGAGNAKSNAFGEALHAHDTNDMKKSGFSASGLGGEEGDTSAGLGAESSGSDGLGGASTGIGNDSSGLGDASTEENSPGGTGERGSGEQAHQDTIINPNKTSPLSGMKNVVDKDGNINLSNLKANSKQKLLYDAMLNDNLKKHSGNNGWHTAGKVFSGLAKAGTGFNPAFEEFANGISNSFNSLGNRSATGKAINDTVKQLQDMSGGNMDKNQALQQIFGGSSTLQTKYKSMQFKNAIAHGNSQKAGQILSKANPFNTSLNQHQKNIVIAQTNPYTSLDGFRW